MSEMSAQPHATAPVLERQTWSLAGAGNVGKALLGMVAKPEVAARFGLAEQPDLVLRKGGWHEHGPEGDIVEPNQEKLPDSPILFVAMPSTPNHHPTLSLIRRQLERGDMVVTAEKAILADHGPDLADLPGKLGYWAAHGGGTKMVDRQSLDTVDPENLREMYANPTATFSFLFSGIANGMSLEEAADSAIEYKFAEPGAKGFFDIFSGEEADTFRKTMLGLKFTLPGFRDFDPNSVVQRETSRDHIMEAVSDPWKYAYLTAMFPEEAEELAHYMTEGRKGGFDVRDAGFLVISGLMPVDKVHPLADQYPYQLPRRPLKLFKTVPGATAAYYAAHGPADGSSNDGWVFTIGSGAGAETTANAMLDNSKALRTT